MIFIGEHTSISHAWISSALESGLRGGVQMLLELGLVDEAKEAVDKWAARWIDIVRLPFLYPSHYCCSLAHHAHLSYIS